MNHEHPKIESKKLDDVLLDVSRDLWPSLAYLIIISAIIYFAINPETFIITAMGIFHLPPQVLMNFYSIAMPLVIAVMLSRLILILWKAVLPYPIAIILILLIFPFFLLDRYVLKWNWFEKLFEKLEKKRESNKPSKSRKFLLSNIILFCSFSILLFACYLGNNSISKRWLPAKNPYMVIIAYSHYYCQITGNYTESECKFWKKKLTEYKTKNSISTPVDYPANYPKIE